MDDNNKNSPDDGKGSKLHLKAPQRIVLKKTVDDGSIKQSFAHGRTKSVAVEVRRKRTFVKAGEEGDPNLAASGGSAVGQAALAGGDRAQRTTPHILKPMTPAEQEFYRLEQERLRLEAEQRVKEELEAKRRAEEEEKALRKAKEEQAREEKAREEKAREEKAKEEKARAEKEKEEKSKAEKAKEDKGKDDKHKDAKSDAARAKEDKAAPAETAREEKVKPGKGVVVAEAPPVAQVGASAPQPTPLPVVAPEGQAAPVEAIAVEAAVRGADEEMYVKEGGDARLDPAKKKLSRAQREDVARQKSESLVVQRLAQVDELRRQKQERQLAVAVVEPAPVEETESRVSRGGRGGRRSDQQTSPQEGGGGNRGGAGNRRGGKPIKGRQPERRPEPQQLGPVVREVIIPELITVGDLANRMAIKSSEVVKLLFKQGMMVTINQPLDQDTATLVVEELGHKAKPVSELAAIEAELAEQVDQAEDLFFRPPVVTVMGHVDHGKTSLLDAIRKTDVTSREFGGITQHIGAYQVTMRGGQKITFLDTPGHAAFTSMRARGAKATDIVVLVVAADDGVMPQTVEAINHARAANVPIVVAVNKIDKPDANPERVMQQLTEYELISEEWGGTTIFAQVSAKTNVGLENLEEMILLQSEVLDLKANPQKKARGVIIEAKLDKGRGPVATGLVQNGTLKLGDVVVAGAEWGKVRALLSDKGEMVQEATPAMPVEIIGLSGVPSAGDEMVVVPDERRAREIALFRHRRAKEQQQAAQASSSARLGDIFEQIQQGEMQDLNVVLKGDVQGSVEAVSDALSQIVHPSVRVVVIHHGVGGIAESDVMLAVASRALVVGFNVRADVKARMLAEREGVELRFYNIIYDLVEDVRKALEGMLLPTMEEKVLGRALVREVFRIAKIGQVAGCRVIEGHAQRAAKVRVLRDNVVIHEGSMHSLKHFKDDVKEVKEGAECGVGLERFNDIKEGDLLEFFVQEEVRQTLA